MRRRKVTAFSLLFDEDEFSLFPRVSGSWVKRNLLAFRRFSICVLLTNALETGIPRNDV